MIAEAEARRFAAAKALRDAAQWWGENPDHHAFETDGDTRNWLRDLADQYETYFDTIDYAV